VPCRAVPCRAVPCRAVIKSFTSALVCDRVRAAQCGWQPSSSMPHERNGCARHVHTYQAPLLQPCILNMPAVQAHMFRAACQALNKPDTAPEICGTAHSAGQCEPGSEFNLECRTGANVGEHRTSCVYLGASATAKGSSKHACKCSPGYENPDAGTPADAADAKCVDMNECAAPMGAGPCDKPGERNACLNTEGCARNSAPATARMFVTSLCQQMCCATRLADALCAAAQACARAGAVRCKCFIDYNASWLRALAHW
jgi:hypothetical protein